jgi:hypothetical protein
VHLCKIFRYRYLVLTIVYDYTNHIEKHSLVYQTVIKITSLKLFVTLRSHSFESILDNQSDKSNSTNKIEQGETDSITSSTTLVKFHQILSKLSDFYSLR